MKKETIIAIIFGVIFGGAVAVFTLIKNKELQLTKTKTLTQTGKQINKPKIPIVESKPLEILEPKDGIVVNNFTITLRGRADKNSLIVIQSATKDQVFKNEKNEFSVQFPLSLGENLIKITMHPVNNLIRSQEKEIRVYNLDEEL